MDVRYTIKRHVIKCQILIFVDGSYRVMSTMLRAQQYASYGAAEVISVVGISFPKLDVTAVSYQRVTNCHNLSYLGFQLKMYGFYFSQFYYNDIQRKQNWSKFAYF